MPLVLGITGGIATGKSAAMKVLESLGAQTMSADQIAREVLVPGTDAYREVVERFGEQILRPDGSIDRPALAALVFSDSEAREALNSITHPRIIRDTQKRIDRFRAAPDSPDSVLAVEIPLLIECGLESMVDQVVLIAAEQETQVGRLTSRSNISPEEAIRRIRAQMPLSEKMDHADHIIWNEGSLEDLRESLRSLWERIRPEQL